MGNNLTKTIISKIENELNNNPLDKEWMIIGRILSQVKQTAPKKEYAFALKEIAEFKERSEDCIRQYVAAEDVYSLLCANDLDLDTNSWSVYALLSKLNNNERIDFVKKLKSKHKDISVSFLLVKNEIKEYLTEKNTDSYDLNEEFHAAYDLFYEHVQALKAEGWSSISKDKVLKKIKKIQNLVLIT